MDSRAALETAAFRLLADMASDPCGVRLFGVTLSALAGGSSNETEHAAQQSTFRF